MTDELLELMTGANTSRRERTVFDLELFLRLNEEYRSKPVISTPRRMDGVSRRALARQRAAMLEERVGIRDQRVLEVGCGAGDMADVLAREYGCEVLGLDIARFPTWEQFKHPKLTLKVLDISRDDVSGLGRFGRIVSLVVWEHIRHPFSALKVCRELLDPDGTFYLRANLHRSAVASHLYRDVCFPWPHLLFADSAFEEFYQHIGKQPCRPSWVNRLTYAEYLLYFDMLGFSVDREWLRARPLDEVFYKRFEDVLSRYPLFDLTHDFFDVVLKCNRKQRSRETGKDSELDARIEDLIRAIGRGLTGEVTSECTPEHVLRRALATLDTRSYRLTRRLAARPRSLGYWLTLPVDLMCIVLRRLP